MNTGADFIRQHRAKPLVGLCAVFYKDSNTNCCRTCGVANEVDRGEACADESAEKRYAAKTNNINNVYLLQKFDYKCKYHNSGSNGIAVETSAQNRLHKAVNHPDHNNISEIIADKSAVYKQRNKNLYRCEQKKSDNIRYASFHSIFLARSGKSLRLLFKIPFMQARAIP